MQLNSPHHGMGPSMSPSGSPNMSSYMGMSGGAMTQCMAPGGQLSSGGGAISSRDYFGDPGSPRSRSAIDSKNYRRSYTHAKPPYRYLKIYMLLFFINFLLKKNLLKNKVNIVLLFIFLFKCEKNAYLLKVVFCVNILKLKFQTRSDAFIF